MSAASVLTCLERRKRTAHWLLVGGLLRKAGLRDSPVKHPGGVSVDQVRQVVEPNAHVQLMCCLRQPTEVGADLFGLHRQPSSPLVQVQVAGVHPQAPLCLEIRHPLLHAVQHKQRSKGHCVHLCIYQHIMSCTAAYCETTTWWLCFISAAAGT